MQELLHFVRMSLLYHMRHTPPSLSTDSGTFSCHVLCASSLSVLVPSLFQNIITIPKFGKDILQPSPSILSFLSCVNLRCLLSSLRQDDKILTRSGQGEFYSRQLLLGWSIMFIQLHVQPDHISRELLIYSILSNLFGEIQNHHQSKNRNNKRDQEREKEQERKE